MYFHTYKFSIYIPIPKSSYSYTFVYHFRLNCGDFVLQNCSLAFCGNLRKP
ncbi:hypothetical protein HanRHA438_Chr12g0556691 [Helianthus annuus]|nr:hypothetical protein HanRHA438_Chr12g0556691 [Helianthus annuus]